MPVEGDRVNIWATHPDHPQPALALSTHMDTVPPFIPSTETDDRIYGRGSCDAKGIIVAQIAAAEKLKAEGFMSDCCSWSAKSATARARRSRMSSRAG